MYKPQRKVNLHLDFSVLQPKCTLSLATGLIICLWWAAKGSSCAVPEVPGTSLVLRFSSHNWSLLCEALPSMQGTLASLLWSLLNFFSFIIYVCTCQCMLVCECVHLLVYVRVRRQFCGIGPALPKVCFWDSISGHGKHMPTAPSISSSSLFLKIVISSQNSGFS